MSFVNKIGLKNFKSFRTETFLDMSLINILIGPNGSGKSTITGMFKFLKTLDFENRRVNTTEGDRFKIEKVSNWSKEDKDPVELLLFERNIGGNDLQFKIILNEFGGFSTKITYGEEIIYLDYKETKGLEGNTFSIGDKGRGITILNLEWVLKMFQEEIKETLFNVQLSDNIPKSSITLTGGMVSNEGSVNMPEGILPFSDNDVLKVLEFVLKKNCVSDDSLYGNMLDWIDESDVDLKQLRYSRNKVAESLSTYLFDLAGPNKENKESVRLFNQELTKGGRVQSVLVNALVEFFEYFIRNSFDHYSKLLESISVTSSLDTMPSKVILRNDENKDFIDVLIQFKEVAKWSDSTHYQFLVENLKSFGIGDDIKVKNFENVGFQISLIKKGKEILISDLGFGFSQIVKLLINIVVLGRKTSAYFEDEGGQNQFQLPFIMILEEPEANLHPNFQSKLADLLVESINKYNVQFIVETHSEYIVRKLQYWVAKSDVNNGMKIKPNHISINYIENDGESSKSRRIPVRKDGMLEGDFGSGFFDESARLTLDLLKIQNMN